MWFFVKVSAIMFVNLLFYKSKCSKVCLKEVRCGSGGIVVGAGREYGMGVYDFTLHRSFHRTIVVTTFVLCSGTSFFFLNALVHVWNE